MKYFEFKEPYYALIKAETEEYALSIYYKNVGRVDEFIKSKEIKEHEASAKFLKAIINYEGNDLEVIKSGIRDFEDNTDSLLLIDGSLI